MGYFSNGSEGDDYIMEYCENCVHHGSCAVLYLHEEYNYQEANNKDSFLNYFIPRDGLSNGKCKMFYEKEGM